MGCLRFLNCKPRWGIAQPQLLQSRSYKPIWNSIYIWNPSRCNKDLHIIISCLSQKRSCVIPIHSFLCPGTTSGLWLITLSTVITVLYRIVQCKGTLLSHKKGKIRPSWQDADDICGFIRKFFWLTECKFHLKNVTTLPEEYRKLL